MRQRPVPSLLFLLVTLFLLAVPAATLGAPPNQLSNASVSPRTGNLQTTFSFSVDYDGNTPVDVTVTVGALTIDLILSSGSAGNGTYSGSRRLPAGTWPVSFLAVAAQNDPTLTAGQVTVNAPSSTPGPSVGPPTPTPAPTSPPAPTPTPLTGTPLPASSAPATTASPTATVEASGVLESGSASAPVAGSASPAPSGGGGGGPGGPDLFSFALIVGGALLVAAGGTVLLVRIARRGEEPEPPPLPAPANPPPTQPLPPRPPADWEYRSLDDEPIGSVEDDREALR